MEHLLKKYLLSFLFINIFIASSAFAKNCQEVRMGLDIGSGSTKIMVAKVDFCQNKILEVLENDSRPVSYNEDLEKSKDGNLSSEIIAKGEATLAEMIAKGRKFKPRKSYAVATSVFRKASNGTDVIKGFARKMKMPMEVISQEEEARLGYLSVKSTMPEVENKNIIVWDIGGGSMQMFSLDKNKRPQRYLGDLASVTFKNMVIEVLQEKDPKVVTTPNPIGDKRDQVVALARSYSKLHVPLELKNAMSDHVIIGVGGVHAHSIRNQIGTKEAFYTLAELEKASKTQVKKSDKDLEGDYRSTDVTNLLLVQGFMEGLGIKEVRVVNASLIQGVLFR